MNWRDELIDYCVKNGVAEAITEFKLFPAKPKVVEEPIPEEVRKKVLEEDKKTIEDYTV